MKLFCAPHSVYCFFILCGSTSATTPLLTYSKTELVCREILR
jgi:hypothetical protein